MDTAAALLAQMEDIELPDQSGLMIAPGWLLIALFSVAVLALLVRHGRKRTRNSRQPSDWRKPAELELSRIRLMLQQRRESEVIPACSRLARRIALARYPRQNVASLTGDQWLAVLDDMLGERRFTEGEGRLMASNPYREQRDPHYHEMKAVVSLLQRLIDRPDPA